MDIHRHVLCHSWLLASPVCHWDKMRRATLPNHSTSSSRVTYQLWHAEWEFLWLQVEHGFTCTDEQAFTNSIVLVQYNLQSGSGGYYFASTFYNPVSTCIYWALYHSVPTKHSITFHLPARPLVALPVALHDALAPMSGPALGKSVALPTWSNEWRATLRVLPSFCNTCNLLQCCKCSVSTKLSLSPLGANELETMADLM